MADRAVVLEHRATLPSGAERTFGQEEVIVSKTDVKGVITYANDVFCQVSGYSREELLGQPHNIVRHPDMPRCAFKFVWDTLLDGREVFAYVKNMARNGDHYWVLAHATPTFDSAGNIIAFHSNRRSPGRAAVDLFDGIYRELDALERSYTDRKEGMDAGYARLGAMLQSLGTTYDELIFSTINGR